jgi:hypothetical protein
MLGHLPVHFQDQHVVSYYDKSFNTTAKKVLSAVPTKHVRYDMLPEMVNKKPRKSKIMMTHK